VVFGKTAGTSVNLSSLPASAGFAIDGLCANEKSGSSVASARDVDGDGLGDLIVSVNHPNGSGVFTNSRAYVILSSENNGYLTSFKGAGTKGADTLTGSGGVDVIYAGAGDDVIELGSLGSLSTSRINGGLGKDTLKLTGAGLTLDLASTNDYALKGIETIDLNTTGANTLKIKFSDLVNMMDPASHKLYINGDGNDTVQMQGPGAWVKTGTGTNAGSTYDIYGYSLGTGFDATATPKTASIEQIWLKQGIKVNSSDTMNAPVVETFDSFAAGGTYAESGGWQGGIVVRDDATLARSREFSNFLTTKTGYTSSGTTANFLQLNDENGTLQSNGTTLTAPTVSKAFSLSGQQKWVEVSFSFYEINTWDTPEKFNVWLDKSDDSNDWLVNPLKAQSYDGGSVQSTSNQVDDSLPAGITGMKFSVSSDTNANGIGFGTGNEEFHTYTIAFQTSGSWFSLGFSASLNDAWNSEAWGVDNLVIRESTAEPPAQTRGTTGGDTSLTGTAANDDIAGGQGADSIVGLAGDDLLVGGLGIDTIDGGDGNDLVLGGRDNDNLSGGNNDDTLIGGEGNDQLSGGTGNDVLIVDADDFFAGGSIVGGAGTDTLTVGDNGMSVNLTVNYVQSIERVNLTGNGANSLTLTVDDVVRLNENTNTFSGAGWEDLKAETKQFVVDGETGDSVISSIGTWTAAGTTYHDGQVYAIFNSGLAQLLIDMDISRTGFPVI
jgi:Ca2+-binding RTX toxin-like protein